MKLLLLVLTFCLIISGSCQEGHSFTGSTPAGRIVRSFLGIPYEDSVDFIRWNITMTAKEYYLKCNYGIGKPNTNGFLNQGKTVALHGNIDKINKIYYFRNHGKFLKAALLNGDLIHFLDDENHLMAGNDGWSYTLNRLLPSHLGYIPMNNFKPAFTDSLDLVGRTPCGVPGIIEKGKVCYKIKWHVVLYNSYKNRDSGFFKIAGTPWRARPKTGTWKMIRGNHKETSIHFYDEAGHIFLYLLWADNDVLVFTDDSGKLLVGDEDFSYTLSVR